MQRTWPEKLAFTMHRYAWYLIQWSVKRRMRKLALHARRTPASWEELSMLCYSNQVCMECYEGDLQLARELLYEQQETKRMRRESQRLGAVLEEGYGLTKKLEQIQLHMNPTATATT